MQQWQQTVLTTMQELMKPQLEAALSGIVAPPVTSKKRKTQHKTSSRSTGHCCRICSAAGADVHRHRDLGIYLDGKCCKQVETFRNGGIIMERREEWNGALLEASHSDLARRMLGALGQVPADHNSVDSQPSDFSSSEPCSPQDSLEHNSHSSAVLPQVAMQNATGAPPVACPMMGPQADALPRAISLGGLTDALLTPGGSDFFLDIADEMLSDDTAALAGNSPIAMV